MKLFELSFAVLVAVVLSTAWDAQAQIAVSDSDSHATSVAAPHQSINIEATKLLDHQTLYKAPDVVIQAAPATAPCRIALGIGGSIAWGGLGASGSVEDEKCTRRENARIIDNCKTNSCIAIMCSDTAVAKAVPKVCNNARTDVGYAEEPSKVYAAVPGPLAAGNCPGYSGKDPVVRQRMGCQ